MASSSSSVPVEGWTYDVFLSFRGEDILNNLVDDLHTAMVENEICVFRDEEMLHKGKPISSKLRKAIEESRLAVVVFPENYANSSWCLYELAKIIECQDYRRQKVLPVFYPLDPSDLQQHEEEFMEEMDKVKPWRKTLAAVAKLSGWHISLVNGSESLFIDIIKIVQTILDHIQPHVNLENNLIGIKCRMNDLESLLDLEATQEVRMVGIYGMSGIGKTTIARALFTRISYKFDGSSFVNKVKFKGICALQQKILKDVLATHHESDITDPYHGAKLMQTRFCNKKILLVLDDVNDDMQLKFLAANRKWFGAGSRIIITSLNRLLLSDSNAIYRPPMLSEYHAVRLFSRHAFRKNSPLEGYEELSIDALSYTGGHPLILKVLGSFFHGKETAEWESALDRLAKLPRNSYFQMLKMIFDRLLVSEKTIFLDICFLKDHERKRATSRLLGSFGFDRAMEISVLIKESLIEKCLVRVTNGWIDIDDNLHVFGLEFVQKYFPNSRLWRPEEVHDYIKKNRELEAIEVILCSSAYGIRGPEDMYDMGFHANVFENMRNLRLLDISGSFTYCMPTTLPDKLQWLRWYDYPFSSIPLANLGNLVELQLTFGEIEHLLTGDKVLPCLKFIDLSNSYYLKRLPDVSWAPNVERLIISECSNMEEVHESLGSLKRLVYLDMRGCKNLKCLPSKIEMPLLETLDISDCSRLEKFPEVSSNMEKLSEIRVYGCSRKLENNIPYSVRELCTPFQKR